MVTVWDYGRPAFDCKSHGPSCPLHNYFFAMFCLPTFSEKRLFYTTTTSSQYHLVKYQLQESPSYRSGEPEPAVRGQQPDQSQDESRTHVVDVMETWEDVQGTGLRAHRPDDRSQAKQPAHTCTHECIHT